jgi:tetratricopeptide (TPR) repeat protein
MDRCDLAVDELQYVLRVHPLKVNAMANLGYCNLQLHRYDEAERNFKRALEILPDSPQLYTNLGTSYFAQNKHELAIEAYREAIELAETTSYLPSPRGEARILQPRLLLANLYVAHDRLDEAIEQYEEALRLAPEREDIRRLLDEIHREAGRPEPPTE